MSQSQDRAEELTLKLMDEGLSVEEQDELEQLLEQDEAARRLHLGLLEQEATLRGRRADLDLSGPVMERVQQALEERVTSGVMRRIQGAPAVEPRWAWLRPARVLSWGGALAALLVLLVGVQTVRVLRQQAKPQEALLYGQGSLTPGQQASYRVLVRNARTQQRIAGAEVRFAVLDQAQHEVWSRQLKTDAQGMALVQPRLAASAAEGNYRIAVQASSAAGESTIRKPVTVKRSFRLLVSTDKPLYQPGQTIHIRALGLLQSGLAPLSGRELVLEVRDAKGNKVFKHRGRTSRFGLAWADFLLADQVNLGRYQVSATVGDTTSQRTVQVKHYRLPKFKVTLKTDRAFYQPGQRVRGTVQARYTFGEPVAGGKVELELAEQISPLTIRGTTDARGEMHFEQLLRGVYAGTARKGGAATLQLRAAVTDDAGETQKGYRELTISSYPIRLEAVVQGGALIPGIDNTLYLVAAYPDGRPARCQVALQAGTTVLRARTSRAGVARVQLPVPASLPNAELTVQLSATDDAGLGGQVERQLSANRTAGALVLQTDRAIYASGETVRLSVLGAGWSDQVYVDLVRGGQTALVQTLAVTQGRGSLALDLPPELAGTLELHGYRLLPSGQMVGSTRVIQVNRPQQLQIKAELDRSRYRPGQQARVRLAVSRPDGKPAVAALSLSAVDEAVFALQEMRPGMERVYFMLQQELLKPRVELHGILPLEPRQLVQPSSQAASRLDPVATQALMALAAGDGLPPAAAAERYATKLQRLSLERREHVRSLRAALALGLWGLTLLLLLLPLIYGHLRLRWRTSIQGAEPADLEVLERAARRQLVWWVLGLVLPPVGGWLALLIDRFSMALAVVLFGLGAMAALWRQLHWNRALRHCPATAQTPLLRKVMTLLPVTYGVGLLVVPALALAEDYPPALRGDSTSGMLFALVAGALLIVPPLSAGLRTALRPTSVGGWFKVALSRLALLVLLPAGLAGLLVFSTVKYRMATEPLQELAGMPVDSATAALDAAGKKPSSGEDAPLHAAGRVRRYFPETLLWRPQLITDQQGRASITVPLADSITTWRMAMSAVTSGGELAAGELAIPVFQPFFVDLQLPLSMTQNDRVTLPAAIYNYLDRPQTVRVTLERKPWFELHGPAVRTVRIGPKQVGQVSFSVSARQPGEHRVVLRAAGSRMGDAVERLVRVAPDGEKVVQTINGQLTPGSKEHLLTLPADAIAGASDLLLRVHPGSFSQVVQGLDGILLMPSGCFEQTSSATYPNVLVLDYLRRTRDAGGTGLRPEVALKAKSYIAQGYQRLLSYEVAGGGFEWFGKSPAHNVLTAYGLMEFSDMSRVFDVDPDVIRRTRAWLLGQQGSDGSWTPTAGGIAEGAINRFRGETLRTTAYIAWALAESAAGPEAGASSSRPPLEPGLKRALDLLAKQVSSLKDGYDLALVSNALLAGQHGAAQGAVARLMGRRQQDKAGVFWSSTGGGVTYSRGDSMAVETTALAAYALLKAHSGTAEAHRALRWIISKKDPQGTWHSTQATVMALRALLEGARPGGEVQDQVALTVSLNGQRVERLRITRQDADVFRLVSLRQRVQRGDNRVRLSLEGKGRLAYQLVATHYRPWPAGQGGGESAPAERPLSISVSYDATRMQRHHRLSSRVELNYRGPGIANMLIVDLGIPAGFAPLPGTFQALQEQGLIERYRVVGQQVTLYLRQLRPGAPLSFQYQLQARYPVTVKTPPSKVYKYYEPEVQDVARPVQLQVL